MTHATAVPARNIKNATIRINMSNDLTLFGPNKDFETIKKVDESEY